MNGRLYDKNIGTISNQGSVDKPKTALIINVGMSKHNIYYSEELLKNYAHKFENVPFFINGHRPSEQRTPDEIVGVFKNVRYDENAKSLIADLTIFKHKENEKIMLDELSNSGLDVGLSAVFLAEFEYKNQDNGERYIMVNSIEEVESVDFVIHPATIGKVLNNIRNKYETKLLIHNTPITPLEDNNTPIEIQTKTQPIKEVNNIMTFENAPNLTANQNVITNQQQFVKDYNKLLIENRMAKYEIDDSVKELVIAELQNANNMISIEDVDNCIKKHNDIYEKIKSRVVENAYPAYVKEEEMERIANAIEGFFTQKPVNGVPPIKSIRKIWQLTTGDIEVTGNLQNCDRRRLAQFIQVANQVRHDNGHALIANSVTLGDWAIAFGNLMYRQLLREYDAEYDLAVWRRLVRVVSANDFRPLVRTRIGGYPNLPIVQELQNYPALRTPSEESIQYVVSKRGGTEEISWESIVNDDVGAIQRIPQKLAFTAARTLFEFVMSFLFDNPTIYDGQPLFSANHPVRLPDGTTTTQDNTLTYNLSNGLSYKDIIRGRNRMRLFLDPSSGKPAGVIPKYIVGSIDFEEVFYLITNNAAYPGTRGRTGQNFEPFERSGGGFTTDENYVRTFNLEYIVNPFLTAIDSNNQVYLVADPNRFETMEVAFLGSEQPEMFVQDLPNVGTYFFADKIVYKIRHVYGGNVLDFRSFLRLQN